jgi:hypothetical protein
VSETQTWATPTNEQRQAWQTWLDERPPHVKSVAGNFDPWAMYRLTTTGQRCQVIGFHETENDGVTVYIYAEHETLGPMTGVQVFGIDPSTLVPWNGSARPNWEVTETLGGDDLGGGYVTGRGVSYRIVDGDV